MKLNRYLASLALVTLAGLPLAAQALDTDVYLKSQGISRDDSPNVLFIFDNSGSMEVYDISTAPEYNGTTTYTGSYDATRVYWSTTSSLPSSTTIDWFPATNNKCTASLTSLGNTTGATGYYASDNVVGWIWKVAGSTSTTQGRWENLLGGVNTDGNRKMGDVECKQDNPADTTLGTYPTYSNNTGLAYGSRYTSNSADALAIASYGKPTLYSGNYLNYKTNPPAPVVKSRMQVAKEAVNTIIDSNKGVRFGLMVFNKNNSTPHGGRVLMKVDTMDDARRTQMKAVVNSITGWIDPSLPLGAGTCASCTIGGTSPCASVCTANMIRTPLSETMWEAYNYLGGRSVAYGNPSPAHTPPPDLCAQDSSNPSACTADGTYESPFTLSCQKSYVVLVTDGDPTEDGNADGLIGALSGIGTLSGNRLDELAGWMNANDVYDNVTNALSGNQTVVTYTVGFGTGISSTGQTLLQNTAVKGGGAYYTANDADSLATALQGAIMDALAVTTSFTAPALSVNAFNTLFNRDEVYFALFKPTMKTVWDGNLKKYTLCKGTESPACKFGEILDKNGNPAVDITTLRIKDTATSFWGSTADGNEVDKGGAGARIASPSSGRKLYTYTGGYDTNGRLPSGGNVDLSHSTNEITDSNAALTMAMLNVATTADRTKVINWVRGVDSNDEDIDGNFTEDRLWRHYDPMHSRPVAVTYGGSSTSPIVKLFIGTNDGMVRMINENTGQEEWSFLPQEMLGIQKDHMTNVDGEHSWGMDGTPTFYIQDRSGTTTSIVDRPDGIIDPAIGDFVYMYISTRRGGKNIYCLDVTPTSKLTSQTALGGVAPKLMWVIRGGVTTGYNSLAQTWSRPLITKIRSGTGNISEGYEESETKRVLIFGGGYDTLNDIQIPAPSASGNAIYIADALTGERIWWASNTSSGADLTLAGMDYSIPSDLSLVDANGDSATDRIYVGDVGGQIWRIDLSPNLKKNTNGGSSGYRLADLACTSGSRPSCTGTPLQNRRRFFYPPNVAQVNDSIYANAAEAKHDLVTVASGDREDPIDLLTFNQVPTQGPVQNRVYVLRDPNISAMSTGGTITYPATITGSGTTILYDATSNALQDASSADITASGIKNSKGWFINLVESGGTWVGEKSLARTVIFGGVLYVTTFIPASTTTAVLTCTPDEGVGRLYALNILNGAAALDFDKSGTLTTGDRFVSVGGGIPSELVTVIREGGVSGLVGPNSPEGIPKNLPRERTFWFQ